MNEKVKAHVTAYNIKKGYGTSDDDIIDTIRDGDIIWQTEIGARRWWTDVFRVVSVDGMLIGFDSAITTGDDSPRDKGWEFDPSSICKVRAKEVVTTVYERIN